ncbi:DUF389 domain-containing protein [Actinomadura sp. WMMB 499]|uniref:DUF389 domain-containing protein n=1 Tax=Actinomadura sp. WMMB 499 TaxID=1219491 RepID=UPI0020C77F1E|nr:DUF389 domain-containing protein [Actinomadura sp. WMMB 499]
MRAIVPPDRTDAACKALADCDGATNIVVVRGAALAPSGDLVTGDVARESANEVLDALQALGVDRDGSIAMERIDLSMSRVAARAERRAPGHGDDAVVWDELDRQVTEGAALTWSFIAFLVLATQIAAVAALIDSPILVVGAMVLGPEFAAVASICYGIVRLRPWHIVTAVRTLVAGFAVAIVATYVCALLSRWAGVIEMSELPAERPLTAFIYSPDRWSFIVALLAGAAGVLSLTAGKSSTLVGVFISVTTVPAAGNLGVALALKHVSEIEGSLLQLVLNFSGMIIAGTVTLLLQRVVWGLVLRRREHVTSTGRPVS